MKKLFKNQKETKMVLFIISVTLLCTVMFIDLDLNIQKPVGITETSSVFDKTNSFSFYEDNQNTVQIDKIDYKVVAVDKSQDLNNNRIQDSLELTMQNEAKNLGNKIDAILSFEKEVSALDKEFLLDSGVEIVNEYSGIYAIHIRGTMEVLREITKLEHVIFLNEDAECQAHLYDGTTQVGARTVWNLSQGYGYTGDPSTAIAILDTGIDDTHTDSGLNVVYWQDFIGADNDTSGDNYSTPTDKGEHGTHCASIAASSGQQISNDTNKVQGSGYLPASDGSAWYGTWFYLPSAQTITLNMSWEDGGSTYCGIHNGTNWIWHNSASPDTTSPATHQVALSAGWYAPMWGNKVGAANHFYSAECTYNSGWINPSGDGYGPFTGVAPDSNVVGLKVLDDKGSGSSSQLLDAFDWLYNYGQDYNVTVVSMSLGFSSIVPSIDSYVTSLVREKGIVCVSSAGNKGTSSGGIYSPASSPDCIAVGSVNKADEIAYYSSVGNPAASHIRPDVVAPGGSLASSGSSAIRQPIFAADSNDADKAYNSNDGVKYTPRTDYYLNNFRGMQGTSMACPFVAGIAQLVIDAMREDGSWFYSWETAKNVKQIICMSTFELENIANGGESYDGDGDAIAQNPALDRTGKDNTEGWGRVSAIAAVQAVTKWLDLGVTETISLDGDYQGNHVEVRRIDFEASEYYQVTGSLTGSPVIDADILIFDTNPDEYGDPLLITSCTQATGTLEAKTFQVPVNGTYYIVIRWVGGGSVGDCQLTVTPFISLESPTEGSFLSSGTILDVDISESFLNTVLFNWDGNTNQSWISPYQTSLPVGDGPHVLYVYAQDLDGMWASKSYSFSTDDSLPVINITSPANDTAINHDSFTVQYIGSDSDSGIDYYEWYLDGVFRGTTTGTNWLSIGSLTSDGYHNITVAVYDKTENMKSDTIWILRDTVSPSITIIFPANDTATNQNTVTVQWTASDDSSGIDHHEIFLNGSSQGTTVATSMDLPLTSDGIKNITVVTYDKAGNMNSDTIWILRDTVSPAITIIFPANNTATNQSTVTVQWTASDDSSGIGHHEIFLNGSSQGTMTGNSMELTFGVDGNYNITVVTYDEAGNMKSGTIWILRDTVNPMITIIFPANNTLTNQTTVTVQWTTSDDSSGIDHHEIFLNGSSQGTTTATSMDLPLISDGNYNITVVTYDEAGNRDIDKTIIVVDIIAPSITVSSPLEQTYESSTLILIYAVNEETSQITIYLDEEEISINNNSPFANLAEGQHILRIVAIDLAGNEVEVSVIFTIVLPATSTSVTTIIVEDITSATKDSSSPGFTWFFSLVFLLPLIRKKHGKQR